MKEKEPHSQSLLRVPLVRQMLSDPAVTLRPRAIDARWSHDRPGTWSGTGFNPFHASVFYLAHSPLATWLPEATRSAREFNENDLLVREVFLAVHDYLHCWAVAAIRKIAPELGFATGAIENRGFEDHVFCFLLTEAVATVGLDYWFLGTNDVNSLCPIGTRLKSLTTYYSAADEEEYRRFDSRFTAQDPGFLSWLVGVYCGGKPGSFDSHSLYHSPQLRKWVDHEVGYGKVQRRYARQWLAYLSREEILVEDLSGRVESEAPWKRRLVKELARMLWEKIKKDVQHPLGPPISRESVWRSSRKRIPNFSWINANHFPLAKIEELFSRGRPPFEVAPLFRQLVARIDFERCDLKTVRSLRPAHLSRDFRKTLAILNAQPRISRATWEPRDLFMLG